MSTYLLTWKSQTWAWDDLEECIAASNRGEIVEEPWSCGNRRTITEGERVFLLKQGSDSPGLMGSGWVTKGSYLAKHWDQNHRSGSRKAWYVNVDWDAIISAENRLPRETLLNGLLEKKVVKHSGRWHFYRTTSRVSIGGRLVKTSEHALVSARRRRRYSSRLGRRASRVHRLPKSSGSPTARPCNAGIERRVRRV